MKLIQHVLIILLMVFCNTPYAGQRANKDNYALIYNGISTCSGCPEALANAAQKAGLPIKYVTNPEDIPALLDHAAIFIIGGTEDNIEPMRKAFNKQIIDAIKKYLDHGGNYLGICGGGFIASRYYFAEDNLRVRGFGIVPATAVDYSDTDKAHLVTVNWRGKNVVLYFQGGPAFILDKSMREINIIAHYRNGEIAALGVPYGKGKVVVVGPHPEADKTWLELDHINAPHWQSQQDLAVQLIKAMLSDK